MVEDSFVTEGGSSSGFIVTIDGRSVSSGKPGQITKKLRDIYIRMATTPRMAAR